MTERAKSESANEAFLRMLKGEMTSREYVDVLMAEVRAERELKLRTAPDNQEEEMKARVRAGMVEIPFPLDRGYLATMRLPFDGLTTMDYERLSEALAALVTDPDVDPAPRPLREAGERSR